MRSLDRIFRRNISSRKTLAQIVKGLFSGNTQGTWYDPSDINLTCRRNLLTYSEQFDNAAWTKAASSITSTTVGDPLGGSSAETVALVSGGRVVQAVSPATASVNYTVSVWVKKSATDGATAIRLTTNNTSAYNTGFSQKFTLTTEWVRLSATGVITSGTAINYLIGSLDASGNADADCVGNIDIWGAQLEVGSTATPYQRITDGIKDYLDYKPLPVLYQDAAGTTPVTAVGQPVGLMLDKSKGLVLGPELVTNGDFTTDTDWTKGTGWTINGNVASNNGSTGFLTQIVKPLKVGRWYKVTFTVTSYTSGTVYTPYDGTGLGVLYTSPITSVGTFSRYFFALATDLMVYSASFAGSIDNISVRELPGNHAFNPSGNSANFPVLSARYNLLTKTEDFSSSDWVKTRVTATKNVGIAPNGTLTANKLVEDTTLSQIHFTHQTIGGVSGITCKSTIYLKAAERTIVWFGSGGGIPQQVKIDLSTGQVMNTPVVPYSVIAKGNGWYEVTVTSVQSAVSGPVVYLCDASGNTTYTGDGTSGIYIWGADLRVTNDALNQPAYQRVNTTTDYDTVGFKPYLAFNGVNQWLQTNSIDFTYGNKMFVSAGVGKLSDAAVGVVAELSTDWNLNNGTCTLQAPPAASTARYYFGSKGTIQSAGTVLSGYAAPITNVLSGIGDISGDQAVLRVNGSQVAISTADQGTGNYGNYPLHIGARAGTSLWFNGRLYGLVIAGKQASAAEITNTETYLNQKTGAY